MVQITKSGGRSLTRCWIVNRRMRQTFAQKKTAACELSNFKFYKETNIFVPANRVKPKKSADARAVLTVPPLQIRLPKSLYHSDVKQEKFEDDEPSGDSDKFNNSFDDKEELETYHNDSNLDEYEQKTT